MQRLLITLLATAAASLLAACQGSGRGYGRISDDFVIYWEFTDGDVVPGYLPCGTIEIEGRIYVRFCDHDGTPVYLVPIEAPNRVVPARELQGPLDDRPENGLIFEHDGGRYVIMGLPDRLLDQAFDGPAGKLLAEHGVEVGGKGWTTDWTGAIDESTGIADLRFAATTGFGLPDPFDFDLQYETIVVPASAGEAGPFVYQRLVGPIAEVRAYVETLLGPDGGFALTMLGG